MQTVFPVQSTGTDESSSDTAITWQLMHNLVECCLLEQWVERTLIHTTKVSDYFGDLARFQSLLPSSCKTELESLDDSELIVIRVNPSSNLLLLVEAGFCSEWRMRKPWLPLLLSKDVAKQSIIPVTDVTELLAMFLSMMDQNSLDADGLSKLKQTLIESQKAMALSSHSDITTNVYNEKPWYETLIASEQWASLMDRPFHPLAKAKLGLSAEDYKLYMAEFNQPIKLTWLAVAKTHLMVADAIEDIKQQSPANYLLDDVQYQVMQQELAKKSLNDTHIAIPVLPWQVTHVLKEFFAEDLAIGTVTQLEFNDYVTYASSSMRSMLSMSNNPNSIKLPMGVHALNSKRYLPALKLINGEKNQAILTQAIEQDQELEKRLKLWDEGCWWGYMLPEHLKDKSSINPWFYQEKPTHLGAMLRTLPLELCNDETKLLPMASLGMLVYKQDASHHIFDEILNEPNQDQVLSCFHNLCDVFLGTMLRCLKMGFAPEMHGQNIVIVVQDSSFTSLLLRDHDSVRIHLPWLARHNISDPEYLSPPDFRNRLYRETPEELIFYLQSLGVSVNIRAIVESLSEHYKIAESMLWQQVELSVKQSLTDIDFDEDQKQVIQEQLLQRRDYPHKTLLLPVIERGADPHGSMPAGESLAINPLANFNRESMSEVANEEN